MFPNNALSSVLCCLSSTIASCVSFCGMELPSCCTRGKMFFFNPFHCWSYFWVSYVFELLSKRVTVHFQTFDSGEQLKRLIEQIRRCKVQPYVAHARNNRFHEIQRIGRNDFLNCCPVITLVQLVDIICAASEVVQELNIHLWHLTLISAVLAFPVVDIFHHFPATLYVWRAQLVAPKAYNLRHRGNQSHNNKAHSTKMKALQIFVMHLSALSV